MPPPKPACEWFCGVDAHGVLDFVGMVPLLGEPADLLNAGLYTLEGDVINAGIAAASAIPAVGNAIGIGKIAIKHGDEALDAIGAITHFGDDAAGLAGKADDVPGINMLDEAGAACKHSFSPDTAVATPDGERPIAEIDVGEAVTARDPGSGEVAEHAVTAVMAHDDPEILSLRIDGETIETTPGHRFLTDHGWKEAAALYSGTRVQRIDGSFGTVEGYSIEQRPVIMWDLTVAGVHTFAVGEGEWVVHNDCGLVDLSTPERRTHILDGDATGGGHRAGAGGGTKSEFDAGWSDDEIMHHISDVATDPTAWATKVVQANGNWRLTGERLGVAINVILNPRRNWDIWTAWPG